MIIHESSGKYNKLHNMEDSSKIYVSKPDGKTWIEWWKKQMGYSEEKNIECCNLKCSKLAEDGAHVVLKGEKEPVWILPLCHECNTNPKFSIRYDMVKNNLVICPDEYKINSNMP